MFRLLLKIGLDTVLSSEDVIGEDNGHKADSGARETFLSLFDEIANLLCQFSHKHRHACVAAHFEVLRCKPPIVSELRFGYAVKSKLQF